MWYAKGFVEVNRSPRVGNLEDGDRSSIPRVLQLFLLTCVIDIVHRVPQLHLVPATIC